MGKRLASSIDIVGEFVDTVAEAFPSCDPAVLRGLEATFRQRYGGAEVYVRQTRPRAPLEVDRIRTDVPLSAQEAALGYSRHSLLRALKAQGGAKAIGQALRARKQRGGTF